MSSPETVEPDDTISLELQMWDRMFRVEAKLDVILEFITALKQGMGNAQNSGGPMAMMARAMLPDFSQG